MLIFENVDKRYSKTSIFTHFNLVLELKKSVITGVNGTGKTTLLLMAAGIEPIGSGSIQFNQQNVYSKNSRPKIGISANTIQLPEFLSGKQLLTFHCQQFACPYPTSLIDSLKFSPSIDTPIKHLSLGNLKKLSLLLAMAHSPDLLLLDEPTNGLDESAVAALNQWLHHYKGQVVIASHDHCFVESSLYQQIKLDTLLCQ